MSPPVAVAPGQTAFMSRFAVLDQPRDGCGLEEDVAGERQEDLGNEPVDSGGGATERDAVTSGQRAQLIHDRPHALGRDCVEYDEIWLELVADVRQCLDRDVGPEIDDPPVAPA